MAGIENYGVDVGRTGSVHTTKASTDSDKTHCWIHLRCKRTELTAGQYWLTSPETLNLSWEAVCLASLQQEGFGVEKVRLR